MLNVKAVSDVRISPDGEWIVFVVRARYGNAGDSRARSAIWIVDTAGGEPPADAGPQCRQLRWSPDGRTLAFVSDRSSRAHSISTRCRSLAERSAWSRDDGRGRRAAVVARRGDRVSQDRPRHGGRTSAHGGEGRRDRV
ncbi:MAG: hypothetical protein WKH64_08955 [Chloroflexia bacterium]